MSFDWLLVLSDVRLQLGRLDRQEQGHQDQSEGQDQLVLLDFKELEVLQAVQVYLDQRALLEVQVITEMRY